MNPSDEARLYQRGCLLVFLSLIVLGCLAYFVDQSYLYGVGLLAVGWIIICLIKSSRDKLRLMAAFREAFQSLQFQEPTLQTGSSYSFPTFTVIFANETDMNIAQAEGRLEIFKRSISELYGHCGSESNPFDAARAVSALYVGWEADFQESFQLDPSGNTWLARMNNVAEQAGTGQPATRSLSDSEGSDKPQPGAEGRSR